MRQIMWSSYTLIVGLRSIWNENIGGAQVDEFLLKSKLTYG